MLLLFVIQCYAVTDIVNLTVYIIARLAIVNAIAVAHSKAALRAVPPDRVLHEPRKHHRECRIEGARIDPFGHRLKDVSTAAAPVAGRPVGMGRAKPVRQISQCSTGS